MTVLDCNVVNCSYNENNCCRRNDIRVDGTQAKTPSETCCASYQHRGCGCARNATGETSKNTEITCEAVGCKFNDSRKCSAKHIGITGGHADSSRETECGSFQCCC